MEEFIHQKLVPVDHDPFAGPEIERSAPTTESQKEIWASVQMHPDAAQDRDISAGDIWEGKRRYVIRTLGRFRNIEQVADVILAQSAEGELSSPVRREIPVEIDNSELLGALGSQTGYRLRMRVVAGEQKIAIAVRDEIARTNSALNLIIDAGTKE